jgi:DNA-binding MarR family transcriptional regulator
MMTRVDVEDVARLRIALARTARWLDRNAAGDGLTRTQLSVLGSTARLGPLGLGELAEIECVNPTMLSRIVGKLVDAGYLRRLTDPTDRRAAQVQVTEAGMQLHRRIRAERTLLLAERLDTLPAPQRRALLAAVPALEALQGVAVCDTVAGTGAP